MRLKIIAGYLLFAVCLVTSGVQACTHTLSATIDTPAADACFALGDTVSFTLEAEASCSEGCTITYSWDFDDGAEGETDETTSSPSCEYNSAGEKTVTLTVTCPGEDPADSADDGSGSSTVTIHVVEVESVSTSSESGTADDQTTFCINENMYITAVANPSGKDMDDLGWERRFKGPEESDTWGDWEAAGSDPAETEETFNESDPGYVEYRARNGSDDTWKSSATITLVEIIGMRIKTTTGTGWAIMPTPPDKFYMDQNEDSNIVLKAKTIPADVTSWPDDIPTWTNADATSDGEATFDIGTVSTDTDGTTVEVACCSSPAIEAIIVIYAVDLVAEDEENDVDLENDICLNAQADYKHTKWSVTITPDVGGTLSVSTSGTADDVTTEGIDGSDPSALTNDQEFWVKGETKTGDYEVEVAHSFSPPTILDSESGTVFEFVFEEEQDTGQTSSGTTGVATVDESAGSVSAPANYSSTVGVQNAGYVKWVYDVGIETEPSGSYTGDVKGRMTIDFVADGDMTFVNPAPPLSKNCPAVSVGYSILSFSVPLSSGSTSYGSSIAGADISIQIDTDSEVELGDVSHDYTEVGYPALLLYKSESWTPTLSQTENDRERTYSSGSTIPVAVRIYAGSCMTLQKFDTGTQVSPQVTTNDFSITSVDVEKKDGTDFEIVAPTP